MLQRSRGVVWTHWVMMIANYQCSHTTFQGSIVNVLLTVFTVDQHSTSSHIPQIMGVTSPSTKAGRNWEMHTRHENIISSTSWNSRWLDLSLLQVSTARLFFFFFEIASECWWTSSVYIWSEESFMFPCFIILPNQSSINSSRDSGSFVLLPPELPF